MTTLHPWLPRAGRPGAYHGVAAAGLGTFLVHLFIWHLIWRAGLFLWHIKTFGPIIVALIVIGLIALGVFRRRRGQGWPWRRRGGGYGYGTGTGPRDW